MRTFGTWLLALGLLGGCAGPPVAPPGTILGYGTPGVETYLPQDQPARLTDLQARCRDVPDAAAPQTLGAACDQLRRTMRNQPGSTLR